MATQQELDEELLQREGEKIAKGGTHSQTNQDELEDQSTGQLGQGVRNALRLVLLWRQRRTILGNAMCPFGLDDK